MATSSAFKPPKLEMSSRKYNAFQTWKTKWNDYILVAGVDQKEESYKCAVLRYTFSEETTKIYESMKLTEDEKKNSATILEKLETYAKGVVNETLERHAFNTRNQKDGELIDDFITELKYASKGCKFCDTCYDGLLRDRLVGGVRDDELRKKLLSEKDLDLKKTEDMCKAYQNAVEGVKSLSERKTFRDEAELDFVQQKYNEKPRRKNTRGGGRRDYSSSSTKKSCKFCNLSHVYGRDNCPAFGKECLSCGKENHFAASQLCQQKRGSVNNIEEMEERVDALFLGMVHDESTVEEGFDTSSYEIEVPMQNGRSIKFKVDTGADVTVISKSDLEAAGLKIGSLSTTNKRLRGPGNTDLKCYGYCTMEFTWGKKKSKQIVYVCKDVQTALLGRPAINALEIVKINLEACRTVKPQLNEISMEELESNKFIVEFPEVFQGLGCMKGDPVKIELQENAVPYHVSASRHVALPLMEPLKKELDRMEALGVIRRVEEPTEWCHPIVLVKKPTGEIRICLDLTKLNNSSKRQFYQLECVDETLAKLGEECEYMTKLDANSGYWQLPLAEESQLKATFISPFGRYCPTRAPFGLNSIPEIFNKRIDQLIVNLEGVAKSTDDFLVYAKTKKEHDARLKALLKVFEDNGITLNVSKCKFSVHEVEFLGHHVSSEGIKPLEKKIDALLHYPAPSNITELRRFMGMAQQLSKFTPELAKASNPLRDLLSIKNRWSWTSEHDKAFADTKRVLTKAPTLAHYDLAKETKIRTDGSKLNGISAVLYQKHNMTWKPVAFASRYLSKAEYNYHNIEIEMLAAVWGCEKMSKYLHGLNHFLLQTDHKPLVPIINNKPLLDMSPRIQRLRMKLMKYSCVAEYVKGVTLKDADALSRAPVHKPSADDEIAEKEIDFHVNTVIESLPATENRLREIQNQTEKDGVLQEVICLVKNGWPEQRNQCSNQMQQFWNIQDELTYINKLLLRGSRIVIPTVLRRSILQKIHTGHLGIEKCRKRARQSVYWPGLNNQITQLIQECQTCVELLPSKRKEPLNPREIPSKPWQKTGADMFEYANKNYLVIMDYYSLWPEVYELKETTAKCVIHSIKDAFSRHGIAEEVISDNGPQFSSAEYRNFAKEWQFNINTSSPYYPKSNGLAEAAVKSVKTLIKKCHRSREDILQGLLILRNTPLTSGFSPAQLLKGVKLRDNVPSVNDGVNSIRGTRNIERERAKAKRNYDRTATIDKKVFHPGQLVVVQDHKSKEWCIKGTIVQEVAPRSYTIRKSNNDRIIRRNRSFVRKDYGGTSRERRTITPPIMVNKSFGFSDDDDDEEEVVVVVPENNNNEDGDSDEETIPYGEDEEEREADEMDMEEERETYNNMDIERSSSGRLLKKKTPTDYDQL